MSHPLVVNLFATFQTPTHLFLLMEFVGGGELFSLLNRKGSLRLETARFYAGEVLVALLYVHSLGVIYRDLKPENILIGNDGHVKLVDFGFSKQIEKPRPFLLGGLPVGPSGASNCPHPACKTPPRSPYFSLSSRSSRSSSTTPTSPAVVAGGPHGGGGSPLAWGLLEGPPANSGLAIHKPPGGPPERLQSFGEGTSEALAIGTPENEKKAENAGAPAHAPPSLKKLSTVGASFSRAWEWGGLSEAPTRAPTPGTGWSEAVSLASLPTLESSSVEGYLGAPAAQTPLSLAGGPLQQLAISAPGGGPRNSGRALVEASTTDGGEGGGPRCSPKEKPPQLPSMSLGDKGSWEGGLQGAPSTPPVQHQQVFGGPSNPWLSRGASASAWISGGPPLQQPVAGSLLPRCLSLGHFGVIDGAQSQEQQQQRQQQQKQQHSSAAFWHRTPLGDSPGGPRGEGSEEWGAPSPTNFLRGGLTSAGYTSAVCKDLPSGDGEGGPQSLWFCRREEAPDAEDQGPSIAGRESPLSEADATSTGRESWVSILLEESKRDNEDAGERSFAAEISETSFGGPPLQTLGSSPAVAYPAAATAAANDAAAAAEAAAAGGPVELCPSGVHTPAAFRPPAACGLECLTASPCCQHAAAPRQQEQQLLLPEERDTNRSCTLCGTSEYMSPETLLRKGQHFCSDAWAFGILLHELVFWKTPFYSEDPSAMYEAIVHQDVRIPHGTPPSLERLLLRLLDKDRRTRLSLTTASRSSFFASFFSFPKGCLYGHVVSPPFIPSLKGPFDAGAFDSYPESTDEAALTPEQQQLCDDWLHDF
ncbi:hypothetical protein Emed_001446 [Eimeria media]